MRRLEIFSGRAMPRPTLLLAGFMFLGRPVSIDLASLEFPPWCPSLHEAPRYPHWARLVCLFRFSSWSARDSSHRWFWNDEVLYRPQLVCGKPLPLIAWRSIQGSETNQWLILDGALLIPVHVGQESCGGIRTRLSSRWSR